MADKKQNSRVRRLNIKQKKKVIKHSVEVRGSFRLFGSALQHIWANKKLFALILLIYGALYFVLVKGVSTGFNLSETRQTIEESSSTSGTLDTVSTLMTELVNSASATSSETASVYQSILFVLISLVVIWALRQTFDGRKKVTVKEVFYNSMYPLVQYILVLLVMVLQMLPALIGVGLYGIVVGNQIATHPIEQIMWFLFFMILFSASVYMLSSSIFASYIVTLPGMKPMEALRSARKLVRFRRFLVIRKVLFLPLVIGLLLFVIFLPLVLYATTLAEVIFLVFALLLILLSHAYFYVLYRELM